MRGADLGLEAVLRQVYLVGEDDDVAAIGEFGVFHLVVNELKQIDGREDELALFGLR